MFNVVATLLEDTIDWDDMKTQLESVEQPPSDLLQNLVRRSPPYDFLFFALKRYKSQLVQPVLCGDEHLSSDLYNRDVENNSIPEPIDIFNVFVDSDDENVDTPTNNPAADLLGSWQSGQQRVDDPSDFALTDPEPDTFAVQPLTYLLPVLGLPSNADLSDACYDLLAQFTASDLEGMTSSDTICESIELPQLSAPKIKSLFRHFDKKHKFWLCQLAQPYLDRGVLAKEKHWDRFSTTIEEMTALCYPDEAACVLHNYLRLVEVVCSKPWSPYNVKRTLSVLRTKGGADFSKTDFLYGNTLLNWVIAQRGDFQSSSYTGLVRFVVKAYPNALEVDDKNGNLPFHNALACFCAGDASDSRSSTMSQLDCLQILLSPDIARRQGSNVNIDSYSLNLHRFIDGLIKHNFLVGDARSSKAMIKRALDIIDILLSSDSSALEKLDVDGSSPLHMLACNTRSRTTDAHLPKFKFIADIATRFVAASPSSTLVRDVNGQMPLHLAMESFRDFAALLLKLQPNLVDYQCGKSKLYPFQIQAAFSQSGRISSTSSVYSLLKSNPMVLSSALSGDDISYLSSREYIALARHTLEAGRLESAHRKVQEQLRKRHTEEEEAHAVEGLRLCQAAAKRRKANTTNDGKVPIDESWPPW